MLLYVGQNKKLEKTVDGEKDEKSRHFIQREMSPPSADVDNSCVAAVNLVPLHDEGILSTSWHASIGL